MTALAEFSQPELLIRTNGYGIGQKDMGQYPNVLGIWLGEVSSHTAARPLVVLETNIDDMNPEIYPYIMDRLLELGARDVWLTPIQMKKGRPAHMISVLANLADQETIVRELIRETSTLGVRVREVLRHEAERRIETVETTLGPVNVKLKIESGAPVSLSPEHEDCAAISARTGIPLKDVYRIVTEEASRLLVPRPVDTPGSGR